jgi:hypothetical protein
VAAVLGLAAVVSACSSGGAGVTSVSLGALAANQEHYDGTAVRTDGRLREFTDPDGSTYVVVQDSHANRVLVEPRSAAERLAGDRVSVTGCFSASATSDRTLRAWTIERVDGGKPDRIRIRSPHPCTPASREVAA